MPRSCLEGGCGAPPGVHWRTPSTAHPALSPKGGQCKCVSVLLLLKENIGKCARLTKANDHQSSFSGSRSLRILAISKFTLQTGLSHVDFPPRKSARLLLDSLQFPNEVSAILTLQSLQPPKCQSMTHSWTYARMSFSSGRARLKAPWQIALMQSTSKSFGNGRQRGSRGRTSNRDSPTPSLTRLSHQFFRITPISLTNTLTTLPR